MPMTADARAALVDQMDQELAAIESENTNAEPDLAEMNNHAKELRALCDKLIDGTTGAEQTPATEAP